MDLQKLKEFVKQKKILFLIMIFLLILLILFLCFRNNQEGEGKITLFEGSRYSNSEELESAIEISQANYSIFIFGSDSDGDNKTDTMNYNVTPIVNLNIDGSGLEDFEIKSMKVTNAEINVNTGKGIRSYPNHTLPTSVSCLGNFYEGCDNVINPKDAEDMGSEKEYILLSKGDIEASFYDETPTSYFIPKFKFTIIGVGSFDYDMILERDGVFSGMNILEYSGVSTEDLVGTFSFDIEIDTSHGKYVKGFVIEVTSDEFVGTGVSNVEIDVVK